MQRSSHGGRGVHGVIEEGYRADLIVENNVELKSVEMLLSVLAPFPRWRALGRIDAGQYGGSSERQKRWPAHAENPEPSSFEKLFAKYEGKDVQLFLDAERKASWLGWAGGSRFSA